MHAWLWAQRQTLAKADVTAKAIDYSLSNWRALTRYLDDANVPIDNNAAENAVRPLGFPVSRWDGLWPGVPQLHDDVGKLWSHHILQQACHPDLTDADILTIASTVRQLYVKRQSADHPAAGIGAVAPQSITPGSAGDYTGAPAP